MSMWLQFLMCIMLTLAPPPLEVDDQMVQTIDYVDQDVNITDYIKTVSADYDDFFIGSRSIYFDGTYYYAAIIALKSTLDLGAGLFVLRFNADWTNVLEIGKREIADIVPSEIYTIPAVTTIDQTDLVHVFFYFVIGENTGGYFARSAQIDWYSDTETAGTFEYNDLGDGYDVQYYTITSIWQISSISKIGPNGSVLTANSFYYGSDRDASFSDGSQVNGDADIGDYLVNDGGAVKLRHYDNGVFSTTETIWPSGGASLTMATAIYLKQGNIEIAAWDGYLLYKANATDDWHELTNITDVTVPHFIRSTTSGQLEITKWTSGTYLVQIINNKLAISSITDTNIVGAWDDYGIDVDGNVFKLEPSANDDIIGGSIQQKHYTAPTCNIVTTAKPITNEYLELYDDSDNLLFQGWVLQNLNNKSEELEYDLRSPIEDDLKAIVDKSYLGATPDEILKDVIDTYCLFLFYTTNITAVVDTFDKDFRGAKVIEVIKWCDEAGDHFTSIRPDFEVYYDDGEDLTGSVSIDEQADLVSFDPKTDNTRTRQDLKISILTGYGDWNPATGKKFVATYQGEANYARAVDFYPTIANQTELQAHVDKIGANRNQTLDKYTLKIAEKGMLTVGSVIAFTSSSFSLTAESMFVMGTHYDLASGLCETVLYDKYIDPVLVDAAGKTEEDTSQRINKVEQYVDNTNNRLDNITTVTHECTGFADITTYTLAFTDGTRTFTISPTGTTFYVYINGVRYTKTEETVTITDTQGMWYIYYSITGVLTASQILLAFDQIAWVATIYWNATDNTGLLGYENHLNVMDWATHEYLHETRGCQWVSGLAVSGLGAATITISAGEIHDEDLHHNYTAISNTAILILYRDAALNWVWVDGAAGRLYYVYNAGTSRIRFDSAGTLTDVDNTKFVNYYLFATPFLDETGGGLVAIMGQTQYNTAALAAAANISELSLAGLPSLEFKPLWKITLQSGATVTVQANQDLRSNISLIGSTIIGATTADAISIADAGGLYTATNVESALQEVKTTADAAMPKSGGAFTAFPTTPAEAPDADYEVANKKYVDDNSDYDPDLMIGSANKAWIPCLYMNATNNAYWVNDAAGVVNAASAPANNYLVYQLPLPTNRGGLKLYVKTMRITLAKASASYYVNRAITWGNDSSAHVLKDTGATSDMKAAGSDSYAMATDPTDVSGYMTVTVWLDCVVGATADQIKIYGVELEVYYA